MKKETRYFWEMRLFTDQHNDYVSESGNNHTIPAALKEGNKAVIEIMNRYHLDKDLYNNFLPQVKINIFDRYYQKGDHKMVWIILSQITHF